MKETIFLCAVLALFSACKGNDPEPEAFTRPGKPTSYDVVGVVKGVKSEGRVVIVEHEDIPGFMDAMVMPFSVEDAKMTSGLKAGDKLEFTIEKKGGDWPITKLKKVSSK